MNIESPYGGGVSSLPGATGSLLPVKFPAVLVLLAGGPQLGSWQVAVVRVEETPVGDASGREYPRAEQNRQRPIDISELHDGPACTTPPPPPADQAGQPAAVGTLSPSDCYPAGPAGPCVAGGPVGPHDYLPGWTSCCYSGYCGIIRASAYASGYNPGRWTG